MNREIFWKDYSIVYARSKAPQEIFCCPAISKGRHTRQTERGALSYILDIDEQNKIIAVTLLGKYHRPAWEEDDCYRSAGRMS